MSHYTKEKNIITIELDGCNGVYRLDINTGDFYGLRGKPIKTCAHKSRIAQLFNPYKEKGTNLEYFLYYAFQDVSLNNLKSRVVALQTADKIDALGLSNILMRDRALEYISTHFKEFAKYMKDNEMEANRFNFQDFKTRTTINLLKKDLNIGEIDEEIILHLSNLDLKTYTPEELKVMLYYLTYGKMWEYCRSTQSILAYIDYCRKANKAPQKTNNFIREFVETKKYYELRKTEFDNAAIKRNYEKQQKAWEFTYGNYVVTIPTCGQDLVTEGQLMHHCVGGYVNDIVNNLCYICFIRHKDDINTPYITCQIYTDGKIGQYYLAYDRLITSTEDKEFKTAFGKYLAEVWNQ